MARNNYAMNGISFANPVEIDGDYCRLALDYAIKKGKRIINTAKL